MKNYEQKYKEALEAATRIYNAPEVKITTQKLLEQVFPELKESEGDSEDDKIREELLEQLAYILPDQTEFDEHGNVLPTYSKRIERYRVYLEKQKEQKTRNDSIREKIISRATSEKQVVLISESSGKAEIGWDTRSLEDTKRLLEYGLAFINKNSINPVEKQKPTEDWKEKRKKE